MFLIIVLLAVFVAVLYNFFFFSGLTNFDLLGDFGRIEWLGNFKLVLFYNIIFAVATIGCLATKFTATVRKEIYARFRGALLSIFWRIDFHKSTATAAAAAVAAGNLSTKDD